MHITVVFLYTAARVIVHVLLTLPMNVRTSVKFSLIFQRAYFY